MDKYEKIKINHLEKNGYKCDVCGAELTVENSQIDHIFPREFSNYNDDSNYRLLCRSCNVRFANASITGREFEKYIYELILKNEDFRNAELEARVGIEMKYYADIVAERKSDDKWEKILIEVKYVSSLTLSRISSIISKFKQMEEMLDKFKFIFLFPGKLTEKASLMFNQNNIEVWDLEYISLKFKSEIIKTPHPMFESLLNTANTKKSAELMLIDKLKMCNSGRDNWSMYQKLVGEILSILFCPPLLQPISEKVDLFNINRRDFIFPNYCETGFWAFLRSRYQADFIVVDAKNYAKLVTKKEILQMANYLKIHGTGLFGIIVCRKGVNQSAAYTLREVWAIQKKLIIILQDNDIEQMLLESDLKKDPESVIRQKIEDFRLSL